MHDIRTRDHEKYKIDEITFLRGASLGGSKITISHDSFLERASFMNSVASSLINDILPGSMLLRTTFSFANSTAGNDESIPENRSRKKLVCLGHETSLQNKLWNKVPLRRTCEN